MEPTPETPSKQTEDICSAPDEKAYLDKLAEYLVPMGAANVEVAKLMDMASNDVFVMLDEGWNIVMHTQLAIIRLHAELVLGMDSPKSISSISAPARLVAQNMLEAVSYYTDGFANFDPGNIAIGVAHIGSAADHTNRMTRNLEMLCS